uniref:sodium-independent sulfate anion transporter isoform X5 n=1 Tax=Callithrix jacchus TaxID=9483 RepID=UPI0023DD2131|nr:sodium-independent sulfate anion transporter isoform X5 [Callithrix jacchus]
MPPASPAPPKKMLGQARFSSPGMAPNTCCCSPAALQRKLPILAWLPNYSLQWLKMDFIAGLSVGLTVIPQALAYAEVAGLPPQYGLYSAFTGCFVYFFLGTSRDVTLGPTAIMSLLVSFYTFHEPAYAVLLAFLSGCIQLVMGVLRLAYTDPHPLDWVELGPARCPLLAGQGSCWTSFPALSLKASPLLPPSPSALDRSRTCWDCRTSPGSSSCKCTTPSSGSRRPASQNNYRIDANQELLAMGLTNVLGSLVSSYPVTGSFGRTAVNAQSGVCTPAGGLVTGVLVLLSLDYLTSLFYYIPKSALAAVIIMAVAPLFDTKIFGTLWRVKRLDLLPLCVTFLLSFWEMQYGILAGALVSLLMLLHSAARPKTKVSEGPVLVLQPASGLHFPAVEALREEILSQALEVSPPRCLVLECTHVCSIDYTVVLGLGELLEDFHKQGVALAFVGLQVPILRVLLSADLKGFQYFSTLEEAEKYLRQEPGTQPYNSREDSAPEHKITLLQA